MSRITENLGIIGLSLLTLALLTVGLWWAYDATRSYTVNIATGNLQDDSYTLAQAAKTVALRHYPDIRIAVRQTNGTAENLKLLERGDVQFAVASSELPPGPNARSVVRLFEPALQVIVPKGSPIKQFSDLKGKRIAVPRGSADYQSLMSAAAHFGIGDKDFTFVGGDDQTADQAFLKGQADARFAVRHLANAEIAHLVAGGNTVVAIDQSLASTSPAYLAFSIPKGAFAVNPPNPEEDVPTIKEQNVLLARADAPDSVVRDLTDIFLNHRQEIVAALPPAAASAAPLVGQFRPAGLDSGIAPLHPGAAAFASPAPSSFVAAHADLLVFLAAALVLFGLWIVELRRLRARQWIQQSGAYIQRITPLVQQTHTATSTASLDQIQTQLTALMTNLIEDLDHRRITEQSFQTVYAVWQFATGLVVTRRQELPATSQEKELAPKERSKWRLGRYFATQPSNG